MKRSMASKGTSRAKCGRDPPCRLFANEEELISRLLASAMGLPRICVFKACRRRKRCFGPGILCLEHHRGIVRKRMGAAIALIARPGAEP
jgi:hypothetical protein